MEDHSTEKLKKIIIVTHVRPDDDSCISAYLLIKALGLEIDDPRLIFAFVPKGERLVSQNDEERALVQQGLDDGTLKIFHIDTGKITDPENGDFDHHDNLQYNCSAEVIVEYFWGSKNRIPEQDDEVRILIEQYKMKAAFDQELRALVELAAYRDTASEVGKEDEKTARVRAHSNHILKGFLDRKAINVRLHTAVSRRGPRALSGYLHNKRVKDSEKWDEIVLKGGMTEHIEPWIEEQKKDKRIELFLEHNSEALTINRANVISINGCTYNSGDIRHYVRVHHQKGDDIFHLIIAEYLDDDNQRTINLTIVHNESRIQGVESLFAALSKLGTLGGKDPFRHHSGAIMNFEIPNFSLDTAVAQAKEHVKMPEPLITKKS